MGNEHPVQNPSQTYFPQMMQNTRLLILDYDVTRYHSFDLFRYLLLDKELFMQCDPAFIPMIRESDPRKQIKLYMNNATSLNPYDNFIHLKDQLKIRDVEDRFNQFIGNEAVHTTYTDLYHQLGILFDRSGVSGYILKYTKDPHNVPWENVAKVYTTDHMMDLNMATAVVTKHRINAIITSSIDIAILLGCRLETAGYYDQITFIVGGYPYNYNPETKSFRHLEDMNLFEYTRKHEFGVFVPFSGLKE